MTIHDANSNVVAVEDPERNVTRTSYDPMNRPMMVARAAGTVTETEYNAFGDVTAQVLNGVQRTKYGYDNYGRQVSQRFPDGGVIRTVYTQSGLVRGLRALRGPLTDYAPRAFAAAAAPAPVGTMPRGSRTRQE